MYLNEEGNYEAEGKEKYVVIISVVWLFVTAITAAGILHCGRCSETFGQKLQMMIENSIALPLTVINFFALFGKLSKLINILKELTADRNSETNDTTPYIPLDIQQARRLNEQNPENSVRNMNTNSSSSPFPFLKWFEHIHMFYVLCVFLPYWVCRSGCVFPN